MSERRGKRTTIKQVENSLKFKQGEIPERRNKVAAKKGTKPKAIWTKEAYGEVASLLVNYDRKTKNEFTEAFMAKKLKTSENRLYTEEQLWSKFPSIRSRLKSLKVLDDDAGFTKPASSGGYSDDDLKSFLKSIKRK